MKKVSRLLLCFLVPTALGLVVHSAVAQNLVTNGDFESNGGNQTAFTNWVIVNNNGATWRAETTRGSIGDGEGGGGTFFAVNSTNGADAYFYQTLTTVPGVTYQLSFYAARPQTNNANVRIDVDVFDGAVDPVQGTDGDLLDQTVTNDQVVLDPEWTLFEGNDYQFTATSAQSTLRFLDPGTASVDPAVDTVSVVSLEPLADDDADGLPDPYEQQIIDADPGDAVDGLDDVAGPNDAPTTTDFDADGASDADEFANGTNPLDPDSDEDGVQDGDETNTGVWVDENDRGTDPLEQDSDGDGLLDGVENPDLPFVDENQTGSDPNEVESDGDGLLDGFEVAAGLDPSTDDSDGNGTLDQEEDGDADGLDNLGEQTAGTDPTDEDSDDDRLLDGAELSTHNTDPNDTDSDGDGLEDGDEVEGANAFSFTSDPALPDTDSDGVIDSIEVSVGTDPRDPADFPAAAPDLVWSAEGLPEGDLTTWDPSINATLNALITFVQNTGGTVESGGSNFSNITSWVNSPGYNLAANPNDSWQDGLGNPATQENVTWEIVFRPGDYDGTHTLFNTGGNGDGTAITLVGSTVEFRFQDANSDAQRVIVSADLSALGPATDFYHVVGVCDVDTAGTGTGTLYVNGALADGPTTSAGTINDWDGGDLAELGKGNNIPGGNPFNPAAFTGDIAVFSYYGGDLLNADIIESRYEEFSGGGAPFRITEFTYDPDTEMFSITWTAQVGARYGIYLSTDLRNWDGDVDDSILADAEIFTYEFANPLPVNPAGRIYFRVEQN